MVNPILHNKTLKKGLYLIPTPIGNLGDISFRAIQILKNSDFILCEDTRVSKKLLSRFEIKTKLISNYKFNEVKNSSKVIDLLKNDKIISMISDAGTPGISDPGAVLVNECFKENINIIPIPGPSAVTTSMSVSGFNDKYLFYGFFPEKEKIIKEELQDRINTLMKEDHEITYEYMDKQILDSQPELVRTMSVKPPRIEGKLRFVKIGTIDFQPCGGTHVKSTNEIGKIQIGKIENKGKMNRRVNLILSS